MDKKMTWTDMKTKFPDEWLLITDFDLFKINGYYPEARDSIRKVYQLPALNKPTAFRYTGESTFYGLKNQPRKF
jgi:hypothetical protein